MEGISDIRIVAVDAKRPPIIRKEPYVDIFYQLSHQAPQAWCEDFNALVAKKKFAGMVRPDEGLYVESWVRGPDDVKENLEFLQTKVLECNERYVAKILASQGSRDDENEALKGESGEQGRLNSIIAGLDFDA